MNHSQIIRLLSSWNPAKHIKAIRVLAGYPQPKAQEFAAHLSGILKDDTQRSSAVWAITTLVAHWVEDENWADLPAWERDLAAWVSIREVRTACIEELLVIRVAWFGWSIWDDLLVLAPLASIQSDRYYEMVSEIVADIALGESAAAQNARTTLSCMFGDSQANLVEVRRCSGAFETFSKRTSRVPRSGLSGWPATEMEFAATSEMKKVAR